MKQISEWKLNACGGKNVDNFRCFGSCWRRVSWCFDLLYFALRQDKFSTFFLLMNSRWLLEIVVSAGVTKSYQTYQPFRLNLTWLFSFLRVWNLEDVKHCRKLMHSWWSRWLLFSLTNSASIDSQNIEKHKSYSANDRKMKTNKKKCLKNTIWICWSRKRKNPPKYKRVISPNKIFRSH